MADFFMSKSIAKLYQERYSSQSSENMFGKFQNFFDFAKSDFVSGVVKKLLTSSLVMILFHDEKTQIDNFYETRTQIHEQIFGIVKSSFYETLETEIKQKVFYATENDTKNEDFAFWNMIKKSIPLNFEYFPSFLGIFTGSFSFFSERISKKFTQTKQHSGNIAMMTVKSLILQDNSIHSQDILSKLHENIKLVTTIMNDKFSFSFFLFLTQNSTTKMQQRLEELGNFVCCKGEQDFLYQGLCELRQNSIDQQKPTFIRPKLMISYIYNQKLIKSDPQQVERFEKFVSKFTKYLQEFGIRANKELDLLSARQIEDCSFILNILTSKIGNKFDGEEDIEEENEEFKKEKKQKEEKCCENLIEEIVSASKLKYLPSFVQRIMIRRCVKVCDSFFNCFF